jgi:phage-related protein
MPTVAVYYRDSDGVEPVSEFIDRLPIKKQVPIDNQIDRLNGRSNTADPLPYPHSSQVEGQLRELRCHYGSEHYRVLYRRSHSFFVLLHMFRKTTAKLPPAEIEIAKTRWRDFKERMDASPRRPPRAIGTDAP